MVLSGGMTTRSIFLEEHLLRTYVSELKEVSGIMVPTKHTVLGRQPDGSSVPSPLVVSIDISQLEFRSGA